MGADGPRVAIAGAGLRAARRLPSGPVCTLAAREHALHARGARSLARALPVLPVPAGLPAPLAADRDRRVAAAPALSRLRRRVEGAAHDRRGEGLRPDARVGPGVPPEPPPSHRA